MKKNVQSITFTNYGYLDFTLNLLESIKKNNIDLDLLVYCTDKKALTTSINLITIVYY